MNNINIYDLKDSGILYIYSIREKIEISPEYQRMGEVWTLDKRQLLIDSIINGFDIPKLYFHKFLSPKRINNKLIKYAIIDGRQRLETIWAFIDGKFNLSEDFIYFEDKKIKAASLSYADLAKEYPELKLRFDQKSLPIICVETDNLDLIEEMFSRLNEAVPLNAAEKRNAFGGPMAKAIRELSRHEFFTNNIPFPNKRYQHREVAAKFLHLENSGKIVDTKKAYLDKFVKDFRGKTYADVKNILSNAENTLSRMSKIFISKDILLKTQGMVVLYFLIFRNVLDETKYKYISRKAFLIFEDFRKKNRKIAEEDLALAKYELLEFDRYSSQGINDGVSIKFRYEILKKFIEKYLQNPNITIDDCFE